MLQQSRGLPLDGVICLDEQGNGTKQTFCFHFKQKWSFQIRSKLRPNGPSVRREQLQSGFRRKAQGTRSKMSAGEPERNLLPVGNQSSSRFKKPGTYFDGRNILEIKLPKVNEYSAWFNLRSNKYNLYPFLDFVGIRGLSG